MKLKDIIKNAPVFACLADDCQNSIVEMSKYKILSEGGIIFNKGETADGMYVIGSGEVELFSANSDGKEQILHVLGEGELCAEVPLFQGGRYPASARAYTDIEFCYVDGAKFIDFACDNPEILLEMLAVISLRTKKFLAMVENLSLKDVTQRLAGYLISNVGNDGVTRLVRSKLELASELGTIPETLSRSIKKLVDMGAVGVCSKDKKSYRINFDVIKQL